jgi:flagellar biosynthetic protein FliR
MSQSNPTSIGLSMFHLGALLFLLSGAHHYVLAAFLRSFELSPPGQLSFNANAGEVFVRSTGNIFLVAVQISAPIMAVNFIVTLTFAILGKAAPSMNVFSESFAARILVGLTLLGLTLGVTAQLVLTELRNAPELMLRLIP